MELEQQCDEAFLEEVEWDWQANKRIPTHKFPRILAIAKRCKSVHRVEEENTWLRQRMDDLTTTNLADQALTKGGKDAEKRR